MSASPRSVDAIRADIDVLVSEAREAMAAEDDGESPGVLTGWVLVSAGTAFTDDDQRTSVYVLPVRGQADYATVGLLESAKNMVLG